MDVQQTELTALQHAYDEHPEDIETALHLAQEYSDKGWLNEALDIYKTACAHSPDHPNLLLEYGNTAFRKSDFVLAVQLFEQLTSLRPEKIEGWNNLGIAQSAAGDIDLAYESFRKVLELEPDNPGALLNMGNYLFEHKKFTLAKSHFERAVSTRPDFPDAWYNLGNTWSELGQFDEALTAYEKALRYNREFPSALKNLGWIHEREGRLDAARECYTEALQTNRADARLHVNLGNVSIRLKKYDDAKAAFLKAVRLAPNDIHGWMGLRGYALAKGDVGTFMRATLAILPRLSDETIAQSIEVLYELNQIEKAEDLLSQADRLGRKGDLLDCMRLLLYRRNNGHVEDLEVLATRLGTIEQPHDAVRKGLARYYLLCEKYDDVVAMVDKMELSDAAALAIRWRAMIGQGRSTEAKREIRSFLVEHPETYDAYFLLAGIEVERGNRRRAEVLLVHALDHGFSNNEEIHANEKLHALFESMTGKNLVEEA